MCTLLSAAALLREGVARPLGGRVCRAPSPWESEFSHVCEHPYPWLSRGLDNSHPGSIILRRALLSSAQCPWRERGGGLGILTDAFGGSHTCLRRRLLYDIPTSAFGSAPSMRSAARVAVLCPHILRTLKAADTLSIREEVRARRQLSVGH